jgi:hypothetical protein
VVTVFTRKRKRGTSIVPLVSLILDIIEMDETGRRAPWSGIRPSRSVDRLILNPIEPEQLMGRKPESCKDGPG